MQLIITKKIRNLNRLNYDLPWRLLNNKIIKIDSKQFEQDLLLIHLKEMEEISKAQPLFQNAYKELIEAKHYFENSDYKQAVLFAEKSYESVLKIFVDDNKGQAKNLIEKAQKKLFDFPKEININGFSENVLMSLPYIRNQTKVGHGEGGENIEIPKSLARLSINLSCALCSYILDNYKNLEQKK